ncbi:MAG TPA: sugar phosphate nucleotidyltransferase [Candidatus Saccharimonadales bacterium]|nr:sugar phosphate nucleotidyltransferase [Candidatus Saccharimonadales bacterium]
MRFADVSSKTKPVRKAVIAAAGFGTRFLPQTKAMPKEMLPLVDKPIIQYIVEELVEAGIEDIILVTGYHKRSIEDHFDYISGDLRANLKQSGKTALLQEVKKISDLANFAYVRQKGPYGSATPLMSAAHLLGDEPFIYTFADDLFIAKPNRFKQMIDLYGELQGTILPCITVSKDEDYRRYGILHGDEVRQDIVRVKGIVEKPGKRKRLSNLASVGGYLLTPNTLDYLDKGLGLLKEGGEFYLTTYVIEEMIKAGEAVFGCGIANSKYYDTGDKLEYLKTVVDFALMHDDIKDDFAKFLSEKVNDG